MKQIDSAIHLFISFIVLIALIAIGIAGYHFIEGWSLTDSLYMTVITLSTVGFKEIHELSVSGQYFTIFIILAGVGTALYILTNFVGYILEGELGLRIGRRRMENKINSLHDHFIICGFGRVGESVAMNLKREKVDFVAIELREECVNKAQQRGVLTVQGDATKNEALIQAGINKARGLIVAFGDDAHNLYAIMTARELNPQIQIIARAGSEDAAKRMKLAGAEHVLAPEAIGGQQMARLALRPAAVQFIETVFSGKGEELIIEEIKSGVDTSLIGVTVKEVEVRYPRVKVLALRNEDGSVIINPSPDTLIEKTHSLTAFGPLKQMENLEGCCSIKRT